MFLSSLGEVEDWLKDFLKEELADTVEEILNDLMPDLKMLEETETVLEHSIFSASMVTNLINDLLDLAKLETNNFNFSFDYFNLVDTIDQAFSQLRFLANQKGVTLKSTIKNTNRIA